jgi:hypothetical protein
MRRFLLSCLFVTGIAVAQPKMELLSGSFPPVQAAIPQTRPEKLIEISRAWAGEFNRRQKGYDVSDVTANSLTISAFKKNAFFYRNNGEMFDYAIRYTMKITFYPDYYTLLFTVTDIYADGDSLVDYKLPDYFTSSGKIKEGYTDLEPSLEKTVNDITSSYYNFILNYR